MPTGSGAGDISTYGRATGFSSSKVFGLHALYYKGRRTRATLKYLIDAVRKKLRGWAGKMLSPGGRLVLIKHVLTAVPLHVLAAMDPPKVKECWIRLSSGSLDFSGVLMERGNQSVVGGPGLL